MLKSNHIMLYVLYVLRKNKIIYITPAIYNNAKRFRLNAQLYCIITQHYICIRLMIVPKELQDTNIFANYISKYVEIQLKYNLKMIFLQFVFKTSLIMILLSQKLDLKFTDLKKNIVIYDLKNFSQFISTKYNEISLSFESKFSKWNSLSKNLVNILV